MLYFLCGPIIQDFGSICGGILHAEFFRPDYDLGTIWPNNLQEFESLHEIGVPQGNPGEWTAIPAQGAGH